MTLFDPFRFVPVVVIDDGSSGAELAHALLAGGVGCAEITLRTSEGLAAIAAASTVPGFVVGAGTVLSTDDLERAVDVGASFVVSPGWDDEVITRALDLGVAVLPGVATATDVQRAVRLGLTQLKFFPAESMGGTATLQAFSGPFPGVGFMPSGGVTASNAAGYLALDNVFAVSGSWVASRQAIADRRWSDIEQLARDVTQNLS